MRKVVAMELVSLDGVTESPEEWAFSYSNDEMEEANAAGMGASDAVVARKGDLRGDGRLLAQPTGRHADGGLHKQRAQVRRFGDLGGALEWNNSALIKGNDRGGESPI